MTTYLEGWNGIGKKTRSMVRKTEKSGVTSTVVEPSEKFAEAVWRIYNETHIRQEELFCNMGSRYRR